ncbi:exonuclease domain-containing protein [Clostridium bowmanii]|uniref:3'-5' exonuclease n=1 Tax=Clostridium bowmanii TaxID=132925 RepID=UPI001C0DE475|nr:3'-5' exonuclease [Clostridium bowmanii]MBU3189063.1 exonuclease domain-containing protein [Clostridium bowmanii]MCA1073835.1 exonuclease domain-containing protein [Clostridium bowmanii]
MNYIVFDLEFNQGYNFGVESENIINPKCPFEIIQIGAIKLNENFEKISTLDILIKPEIYTTLNPFVKNITGLTMDELDKGKSFKEMYSEFMQFIQPAHCVLCVWGAADIKELFRNIEYHGLDAATVPTEYINIQSYASKALNCKRGINIGLSNAAQLLDIPIESQLHNAFNDAYYTAEVFKIIYSNEIKIKVYDLYNHKDLKRSSSENHKIDLYNLMKQFEKMFKRQMTEDEQFIIKLAYIMGKTNQFQIKIGSPTTSKK